MRTWFTLADYEIPPPGLVNGATSQYRKKIQKEESVHIQQFMRTKGFGFEDMYSLEDALFSVGLVIDDEYFDCETEQEASQKIGLTRKAIRNEKNISDDYWFQNRGYCEREAKRTAGYNEAYLYHWTYEKEYGAGDKIHKTTVEDAYYGRK